MWEGLIQIVEPLNKLCGDKVLKIHEKYPCLNTKETSIDSWWDKLNWGDKVDVGSAALYFCRMSANYKWDCGHSDKRRKQTKFKDLSKGQQRIIKYVWERRNTNYTMFYLPGLFKCG